jgi:hypothetical protein
VKFKNGDIDYIYSVIEPLLVKKNLYAADRIDLNKRIDHLTDYVLKIEKKLFDERLQHKSKLDDLKWRITMMEEKLKDGEPIVGTVPLQSGTMYFTKDKAFKQTKEK